MTDAQYIFGPIPSRRLGRSLGVSPVPEKTCNYTCVYCQLGRTAHMINERRLFYPVDAIIGELADFLKSGIPFDVITVVGEGEPTLYSALGELIQKIKLLSDAPVAVITNGALMHDKTVREDLCRADIVLPSLDAFDERSWKKINRPYPRLDFKAAVEGLIQFGAEYTGEIWLEIMLVEGINTSDAALAALKELCDPSSCRKLGKARIGRNGTKGGRLTKRYFDRPAFGRCLLQHYRRYIRSRYQHYTAAPDEPL